ncbi:MAG: SDR family NAD(P)-dependent oxidoreductase, partial [Saprospiraceae bacterium]
GAAVRAREERLDVLINNAGVWNSTYELTEDGIETVFATNHLAYFLLTHELYPLLAAAPHSRVINVASDSHQQIKGMRWDDLGLKDNYHGLRSYAQSKLANVLFTYELQRRFPNDKMDAFAVQPGLVQTDIGIKGNNWLHALAWRVRRRMSGHKTPAEGAATSIYLATAPEVSGRGGTYWDDCRPKESYSGSNDPAEAERLWQESLRLCGLPSFFTTPTIP